MTNQRHTYRTWEGELTVDGQEFYLYVTPWVERVGATNVYGLCDGAEVSPALPDDYGDPLTGDELSTWLSKYAALVGSELSELIQDQLEAGQEDRRER